MKNNIKILGVLRNWYFTNYSLINQWAKLILLLTHFFTHLLEMEALATNKIHLLALYIGYVLLESVWPKFRYSVEGQFA